MEGDNPFYIIFFIALMAVPILLNIFGMPEWLSSFVWNFANLFAIAILVVYFFIPDLIAPLMGEGDGELGVLLSGIGIYIACSIRGIIRIKNDFEIEITFMDKVMLILNIPCLIACFLFGFTLYEMFKGSTPSKKSDTVKVTTDDIGREIIVDEDGNKLDSVDSYDWDGNVRGQSGKKYTKKND